MEQFKLGQQRDSNLQRTRSWEPLALEDVAQMPAASCAGDLCASHAEGDVVVTSDCAWDGCKIGVCISKRLFRETAQNKHPPSKNAGQPQPLLNFVALLYKGVSQAAQEYTPSS